ncbi:hypothetical protein pclt_cds_364 [Pandoravirus celtis]|uniref:Uncharacterized protein n=1 Tax=Pandoravirus celtis TaxID=2568002 RepID=A0A4D6EGK3_9VIRU|nr:hypothetical protein pclt_cds_364 [Pandoravirus celtis]
MTDTHTAVFHSRHGSFTRHKALYAAMTYPRTSHAVDEHDPIEICTYTCSDHNVPTLYSCQKIARESDELRATNVAHVTTEIVDDIARYWDDYGACRVDGFDVRAPYGVLLRMRRESSPDVATSGRIGVVDISSARA